MGEDRKSYRRRDGCASQEGGNGQGFARHAGIRRGPPVTTDWFTLADAWRGAQETHVICVYVGTYRLVQVPDEL